MNFVCPKCGGELREIDRVKKCPLGHSFDRAKEGYYNLLPGGAGAHGDNREMVLSRRAFLEAGHYAPLSRELCSILCRLLPSGGCVLDAGCGEGYYTAAVAEALHRRDGLSRVLAFDVSKDAVRYAARRRGAGAVSYAVATSYAMPIADGTVDAVVNVFSPMAESEVARVLRPGGYFIFAYPDCRHLWELKSVLYDTPYENKPAEEAPLGFEAVDTVRIGYSISLDGAEQIMSLYSMTPYAYRTPRAGRERLEKLSHLDTRVEFCIAIYRKKEEK